MAGESIEPTRRKHHRSSSIDDAEERSKRRKHRHHHRHRHRHHHRHRSSKDKEDITDREELERDEIDDTEVTERKLECTEEDGGGSVEIPVKRERGLDGVDYEMEEGEILEEDGSVGFVNDDSDESKKNLHSNLDLGGIKTNGCDDSNMGVNEESLLRVDKKVQKPGKDKLDGKESGEIDQDRLSNSVGLSNRGYALRYPDTEITHLIRDDKQSYNFVDEVDASSLRKSSSSKKLLVTKFHSHDKHLKESSLINLSKSPEWSRGRSRSQSVVREASVEDPYHRERKHQSISDDERAARDTRKPRHNSRDIREKGRERSISDDERAARDTRNPRHGSRDIREKERERSSSSRYMERVERPYNSETHDTHREGSRDVDRDRDRIREKERKEEGLGRDREKNRLRDRYWGERDQDMRENDRDWERERGRDRERGSGRERDRVREDHNKNRERHRQGVRDGRSDRDKDRDNDRRQNYDKGEDVHRDSANDSRHRRNYEEHYRENTGRTDLENGRSKDSQEEKGSEILEREEDYQEKIAVPLAEQEEDDLERIKEESRRRRQAILEKYKNKQQKPLTNLQGDTVGESSASAEAVPVPEKSDNQVEGADDYVPEPSFAVGKLPSQNGLSTVEMPTGTGGLGEGTPKSERSDDMFCDDIFGESPAGVRKTGRGDGVAVEKSGINDNWDDAEGYYDYRFGEVLDGRYEIIAAHGKGVFSTVVRAKDLKANSGDPEEVAIKIIRNNETMYKAGMEELVILKKLVGADPESKRHCVRFLSTFKYRNHLCLVFESLHMNLREVLKKFGRNIGLKLTAVRAYAKQLFIALKHLKNCGVLHCDIKPDNMLVNEAKNVLKLCDFGNAMFAGKNEITPYLVSRFYRSPEIILGLPYDHPMDIWSVGCCLFELYTGKVLFPGPSNNDMLRLHMELKGPFPKKMLRKGAFTDQHFDQDLNFLAIDEDPVSKKPVRRLIVNIKPKDFGALISGSPGEDPKLVANFRDLMEKIFVLDPDKRFTVSQALSHPFITGK